MSVTKNEKMVKVVFAGETSVGKTAIIERSILDRFLDHTPTVGAAFSAKKVTHGDKSVMLGIWDTAGQERYQVMSPIYFRQVIVCVLVFDITNYKSFQKISMWKQLCDDSNREYTDESLGIPIYFLVGNKFDMKDRAVGKLEIESFCQYNNISHYVETSASNGTGIKTLYEKIAEEACTIKLPVTSKGLARTTNQKSNDKCYCYH